MSIAGYMNSEEDTAVGSLFSRASRRRKHVGRRRAAGLIVVVGRLALAAVVLSVALVLCLRWVAPPTSAFMVGRHLAQLFSSDSLSRIRYHWVDWEAISPHVPLAVVAAEDQKFSRHAGFDFDSIGKALEKNRKGGRLRGASTISQQVAKNLFLWPGKSYVRKGLEAYFTVLLECLWPKKRILEVYVNIAEFGNGIYGVHAAAESVFGKKPAELTKWDAALLAAVLPNPKVLQARKPSSYVMERRRWIATQMRQLNGTEYLQDL
ncbi:MAG: monofunctional biosynthetic peptidoglycan transglycosylase [Desulfobulbaceae bacterium]|nr:monofunctional biosynthetic peptidoglycan transglycosylase [Desulfobulbaceae bacterium]